MHGDTAFLERVRALGPSAEVDDETLAGRASCLVRDRPRTFGPVAEHLFDQFPLHVAVVPVSLPSGRLLACGAHVDHVGARARAVRRAIELHLAGPEPPTGVAAAGSWRAALERGLLQHCLDLTVAAAGEPDRPFPPVDVAGAALDDLGSRHRELLDMTRSRYAVHDVTALPGVPAFAFSLWGRTVAYRAGVTAADAIRDGLEQLLLAYQAPFNPRPPYAPPPVPQLPGPGEARPPGAAPARAEAPDDRIGALVVALESAGRRPFARPLDRDPAVRAVLPYVLAVEVRP